MTSVAAIDAVEATGNQDVLLKAFGGADEFDTGNLLICPRCRTTPETIRDAASALPLERGQAAHNRLPSLVAAWLSAGQRVYDRGITTRRIVYWLAAMVGLLVIGTIIGLVWADTSNAAGAFAGVTNIVSVVGIVLLVIVLALKRRRRPS